MESVFGRYRNLVILAVILCVQVLGLAVQIRRNTENEPTRLIRIWAVNAVSPFEKSIVWLQNSTSGVWHNYLYLRGVRQENRDLKAEIEHMRIEQVRMREDAEQARRLQLLLGFKEQFISQTVPAQVIGSSGSEQSRTVYIDKGWRDGIRPDMAVVTADGVVGKVLRVFGEKPYETSNAQVLLINDQSSGVGAILEKSRLQGVLKGTSVGEVVLEKVMSDEEVQPGERVLTSGGDLVFPKGMLVGTVSQARKGNDVFLNIRVKPSANLSKLEEVLIITKKEERTPAVADSGPGRAADILAQRLPSVPDKPAVDPKSVQPGVVVNPTGTTPKPPAGTASLPSGSAPANGAAPVMNRAAAPQKIVPSAARVLDSTTHPAAGNATPNAAKPKPVPPAAKPAEPPAEDKPH